MTRMRSLDNKVRELEESFTKAETAVANAASQVIEVDIPDDLGVIEMSGSGRLERIELDLDNLPYTTAPALSAALLEAIVAAEEHVAETRRPAAR
jgi:DNA-binding protein YbaB